MGTVHGSLILMGNEWLFLIIILFVAVVLAGVLLYYFLNIGKRKFSAVSESYNQKIKEPSIEPVKLNNLENLLRESINRQNNIVGSISLLIQKIDNLEKREKNLPFASAIPSASAISSAKSDDSKDAKFEKLSSEIEKISPLLKTNTEGLNSIELKLNAQEEILKNIKNLLTQFQTAKVEKIEIKGIEELKSKINEIATLLKIISGS